MATTPIHLVLDNTYGAMLIGVIISAALWGVSCTQAWFYFEKYESDQWFIKLMVATAWATDTVHQILISHAAYIYLVKNFANPVKLGEIVWSMVVEVLFTGFTAFIVQSFFAYRVYKLSHGNLIITGLTVALVVAEIVYVTKAIHLETYAQLVVLKNLSMAVNAIGAAGDVVIAGSLCFLLQRSRTGFQHSSTMINKLMIFTVNTGLLTSICAIMSLIMISVSPNSFLYITFFFTLGRLYVNSLLATLNARASIRESSSGHVGGQSGLSLDNVRRMGNTGVQKQSLPFHSFSSGDQATPKNISIKIDTAHEFHRDGTDQDDSLDDTYKAR
ncbi:hypothetical protein PUNSTDRAFT_112237 [Punctularia strigosozonata HHB-11173 SS5]|uniref:uncharacterized protein n=1 Tax=Punctularia strigosozonata (strain HHB-11173) TaxID=741275 RepID=UPI00044169B9|nr:uncharacterized protein PUNSTDRAFT_112237 [Punctularia strigosozonata HHB-11173 SS5]EIN10380.1 hypothetical protein PUNSTDRAFT_112237 [Punctularia strigosozonata HHB-11173 SS5]